MERHKHEKLSWKVGAGSCRTSPALLGFGFCPQGAGEPSAWGNGMATSHVCLTEVIQVSGQWKHWKADGRMETEKGAIAIVQARNDGAGEKGTWTQPNLLQRLLSDGPSRPIHSLRCPGLTEDTACLLDQHYP